MANDNPIVTPFDNLGGTPDIRQIPAQDSTTSAPSKAKLDELRVRVQQRLRELREAPKAKAPNPPPPYDEVFYRGLQWLDELAAGPDLHEEAEP